MDRFVWLAVAAIAVSAIYRLLHTYRKSTMDRERGDDIQRKLQELRKKKDEDE